MTIVMNQAQLYTFIVSCRCWIELYFTFRGPQVKINITLHYITSINVKSEGRGGGGDTGRMWGN